MSSGLSPNVILDRGGDGEEKKNLMKGTNLCEWLRGIILVRGKKKNGLKMLLFKGEEGENGTEYM